MTHALLNSILFAFIGIVILIITFVIVEKIAPENLWKQIVVEKNNALAILGGAFMIAMAIIIAAAIQG